MGSSSLYAMMLLTLSLFVQVRGQCKQSSCSKNGPKIRFPFRLLDGQPAHCGFPGFELSCKGKHTVFELPLPAKFFVKSINYTSQEVKLYDPNGCLMAQLLKINGYPVAPFGFSGDIQDYTIFKCSEEKRDFAEAIPCVGRQIYAVHSERAIGDIPLAHCTKMYNISSVPHEIYSQVYSDDAKYLSLNWTRPNCSRCEAIGIGCKLKGQSSDGETECFVLLPTSNESKMKKLVATGVTLGTATLAVLLVLAYHFYSSNKQEKETLQRLETFLEDYKALKPSRYSYADIKHITDKFKDKLGEGAFGTVYKGKLSNNFFVAVKILNNMKGNGEEFINEVGTLGQIHHLNVIRLVGYCADGFRRALVFQYLANGSLQQYIASPETDNFLGWKNLLDIALGVAKGIEYLHQGCEQRILHFDIKPHNVLLDENFTPKIADFGLAKLCSKDQSIVSMTTARGTMGYIAPEIFSRNFGNVSYKSDVYSFGMLLLEMVGGRKITNENNTSEIYFPEWIYNLLEEGDDLRIRIEEEGDTSIAKNMAIVGLWCIQWHPVDRPTMQIAVNMLEGSYTIGRPPNPFSSLGSTEIVINMPLRRIIRELEPVDE